MNVIYQKKAPKITDPYGHNYFNNRIQSSINEGATLLGWVYLEERNYFTIGISDDPVYQSATPLLLHHRTAQRPWPWSLHDASIDDLVMYPALIESIGCDDGSYGWRFTSKDEALRWFNDFVEIFETPVSFTNGYQFFDNLEENRVSFN